MNNTQKETPVRRTLATLRLFFVAVAFTFSLAQAQGVDKWWDIDGATPGAGGAAPGGAWTGSNWSTDSTGSSATTTFTSGDVAFFSAGTDAIGTFTVSGNATAGGINVEEGKVVISGTITLGGNPINIASGGTLSINSSLRISASTGSVITINGGTVEDTNPSSAGSFVDVDQTIVLNGGGTLSYTTAGVLNIVQTTTTISGTGPLVKEGAGILAIASACTYSGATIINNGTLRMRTSTNRLPTGTDVTINSPGVFDPAVNTRVRSVNGDGNITFSLSGTLTINGSASFPSSISGVISDGSVFGKITKSGASTLTLSGVNTYDGTFTLTAGTCTVASTGTLIGSVGDVVISGGTLNLNNAAQTIENLSGTGGTINLGTGHTLTSEPAGNTVCASLIKGDGALVFNGPTYTLSLSNNNTYAGGTTVSAGTVQGVTSGSLGIGDVTVANGAFLTLSNAAALGSTADLTLDASPAAGTVNLNFAGTQLIKSLYFGATSQAIGTWGAIGSGADNENAAFTGTGLLRARLATTTSVTDDTGSPTVYGGAVTFTATVTGSSPTGTVQFKDGTADLGAPVTLVAGQAQITVTTLSVSGSPHSITAVYSGDDTNAGSTSSAVLHSVTKAVLNVSANGTLTYGRDPSTNAVYDPVYYPLLNGDLPGVVTGSANFSTDASYTSYVGSNYVVTYLDAGTLSAANYDFAGGTNGIMTVVEAPLTVTNVAASDKTYDGTTTVAFDISGAGLDGFVNGDEASVTLDSTGVGAAFDTKHAGAAKTVTFTGFATIGDLGTNYTVVQPTATAAIAQTNLTVTAVANVKDYDGTTNAAAAPTITAGSIQPGDTEPAWTESYDTKHVGAAKTLTPAGVVTDGNSGLNYSYTYAAVSTGVINQTNITVTATTNTKPYDGTVSAAAVPSVTSGSVQPGDVGNFTETYDTPNVGTGKALLPAGSVTDGNGGANYNVTFAPDSTGVITAVSSTTALASSLNPSTNGDLVTFTATVSSGAGTPTGDVVFKTNGIALATVALSSGSAATATADLPAGTNTVTAEYAAQANWLSSNDSLDQVVESSVVYSTTNVILSIVDNGGGSFNLTFQGTPLAQYYLVASPDVTAALSSWTPVVGSTNTAPSPSGQWSFGVSAAAPQYYRLKAVNPAP